MHGCESCKIMKSPHPYNIYSDNKKKKTLIVLNPHHQMKMSQAKLSKKRNILLIQNLSQAFSHRAFTVSGKQMQFPAQKTDFLAQILDPQSVSLGFGFTQTMEGWCKVMIINDENIVNTVYCVYWFNKDKTA